MSDRLEEFRRQRGLLRAHLDWLEREIEALEGTARPAPTVTPPPVPAPPARVDADAEAILAEYRRPPVSIQRQARFGCLLYFTIALAFLALGVAVLYFLVKRAHGH